MEVCSAFVVWYVVVYLSQSPSETETRVLYPKACVWYGCLAELQVHFEAARKGCRGLETSESKFRSSHHSCFMVLLDWATGDNWRCLWPKCLVCRM